MNKPLPIEETDLGGRRYWPDMGKTRITCTDIGIWGHRASTYEYVCSGIKRTPDNKYQYRFTGIGSDSVLLPKQDRYKDIFLEEAWLKDWDGEELKTPVGWIKSVQDEPSKMPQTVQPSDSASMPPTTPDNSSTDEQQEYIKLRTTTDPIEAFNLFIKRNCPDLYAHFIDSDDNEAEFVRRAIEAQTDTVRAEAELRGGINILQTLLDKRASIGLIGELMVIQYVQEELTARLSNLKEQQNEQT